MRRFAMLTAAALLIDAGSNAEGWRFMALLLGIYMVAGVESEYQEHRRG